MSKTVRHNDKYQKDGGKARSRRDQRRISARVVRRAEPDLRRMSRSLVAFALLQTETAASGSPPEHTATPAPATERHDQ